MVSIKLVVSIAISWIKEEDIDDVVIEGCNSGEGVEIVHRLGRCADKLQRWGRRKKKRYKEEILDYEAEMERLRDKNDAASVARFKQAQHQHVVTLVQEESFWRQRAKMHWLKEGDLNTRFFHMSAIARTKVKKIEKLQNEANEVVTRQNDLCEVARKYFEELFKPKGGIQEPVLALIRPKVLEEDNISLEAPITKEELRNALFQMHPDKSPGPDGFNPAFFQQFWDLCGDDIFVAAKDWLDRGYFPSSLNETNICLIPKRDNPSSMGDYRPISLCNVLYKMVSKLLANRLKMVLDKCISEEQSAFVEGRYITDNALIAIEIIHALKRKTRGVKGELALKIDISKAYDKVEWSFLKGVLSRMGFSEKWMQWMMLCVSSVNYSALVNFEKVGPIHPGRGLRQGDPLSPYLFILVAEGLTALISKAVANGELHGVKICRGAPSVSHLLFADDCFIFCRSNLSETRKLMEILKIYEDASGQEINLSKSEVFFSRNISRAAQVDLSNLMGVRHVLGTGTYLGFPSMVGRSKKATFAYIKDRIWRKINSWRSRPLSKAGKEVMIKSVLQSIPAYVMSIYLLPDSLINEIERMINAFWWGGGNNNKGIRWFAWDKLACSKEDGGLGFRDFQMFNMAMVAKQGWNFISKPTSLVARVFKARWRIGDGSNIKVMNGPWLRDEEGRLVESPQMQEEMTSKILAVPLLDLGQEDKLIWDEESDGVYSVKSGYRKLMRERDGRWRPRAREEWVRLWKVQAPLKAKHFLWRICKECLPTRVRLRSRHVQCPQECPLCLAEPENDEHIFFNFDNSIEAWSAMGIEQIIHPRLNFLHNVREFIFDVCCHESKQIAGKMAMLLWSIWQNRNNMVWNNNKLNARQIGMQAAQAWNEWALVRGLLDDEQQQHAMQQQTAPVAQQIAAPHVYQWQPPFPGYLKCNVDASFYNAAGVTGGGWCLRDHRGHFILAGTHSIIGRLTTLEGEAMALKEAMCEVKQRGLSHVMFESDSKSVVDAITSSHFGSSEFSAIISHVKSLLLLCPNFEVKFVKRQANMVAHSLARAAYSMPSRCIFESIPRCIENYLIIEMN